MNLKHLTLALVLSTSAIGCSETLDSQSREGSQFTSPNLVPGGIVAEVARLRQINNMDLVRYHFIHEIEVDNFVQSCMAEHGFEYFPAPAGTPLIPTAELIDLYELAAQLHPSSVEFRESFGYGVSTLEAYRHVVRPLPIEQFRHTSDWSEAKLSAYDSLLWGTESTTGCVNSAIDSVEFAYTAADGERAAFDIAYWEALQRASAEAAFVDAEFKWSRCARGRGYQFSSPFDVPIYFDGRLLEILEEPTEVDIWIDGELPPEYEEPVAADSDSLYDPEILADLQVEEIATARHLNDCDNAFVEATQERLNQLAAVELAGTPFRLTP